MVMMFVTCECGRRKPCARQDEPCKYPQVVDREAAAFEAGARAMREVAAHYAENYDGSFIAEGIRTLPLPVKK